MYIQAGDIPVDITCPYKITLKCVHWYVSGWEKLEMYNYVVVKRMPYRVILYDTNIFQGHLIKWINLVLM